MLQALLIAYLLGGLTLLPLVIIAFIAITIYTSTPIGDADPTKGIKSALEAQSLHNSEKPNVNDTEKVSPEAPLFTIPGGQQRRPMQGWVTARRTFFELPTEGSYVNQVVRSFLDSRSKDPKRARPRDTFYAVLKGSVLFLYEDEAMNECWAAIEMSSYKVGIFYPQNDEPETAATSECVEMLDGELFAKRNAIVLRVRESAEEKAATSLPDITQDMQLGEDEAEASVEPAASNPFAPNTPSQNLEHEEVFDQTRAWYIFIKSNTQMEDWYLSLVHTSLYPSATLTLAPLSPVFSPDDMDALVSTLDNQPDPIPMRWLNALIGRVFFSVYRTARVEDFIISRLRRKLAKVKRPSFLTDIVVREASVGNTAPMLSKPMLKELTKEGEASVELGLHYKGEVRIIVEATASINLGTRFKSYEVKIVLAILLKEIQGNLLVRVKSPPSNRAWYAFTSMPKLELEVVPVVSDRQIKWSMILKPMESILRDVIQESVVMPNMDDIPFFDTSPYAVRGGIYPDAKRADHAPNVGMTEVGSTVAEGFSQKLPHSVSGLDPGESHSSKKVGDLVITGVGRADTATSLPALPLNVDESKFNIGLTATSHNRRSSWFGSPKFIPNKEESDRRRSGSISESDPVAAFDPPPELERTDHADAPSTSASRRSKSPIADELVPELSESEENITSSTTPGTAARSLPRLRSPSVLSHRSAKSADFGVLDPTLSVNSSRADTMRGDESDASSSRTAKTSISTASSILATWKSRATDKQLGNTARDAMKKWGWGGVNISNKNSIEVNGSAASSGSSWNANGRKSDSKPAQNAQPKQTFAEMRAHVEERRQADRKVATAGESSIGTSELSVKPTPEALEPAIETQEDPQIRTLSSARSDRRHSNASAGSFTGGLSAPQSPNLSAMLSPSTEPNVPSSPRYLSPSSAKTTTEITNLSLEPSITSSSMQTASSVGSDLSTTAGMAADISSSQPINAPRQRTVSSKSATRPGLVRAAQPSSAAMMMVPSIHASHRGEVMSLGYAPPTPPKQQVPSALASSPAESSSIGTPIPGIPVRLPPSIQNVYRLFNKSTGPGATKPPGNETNSLPSLPLQDDLLTNNPPFESQLKPAPQVWAPSVKPTPPPLPPRNNVSAAQPAARPDSPPNSFTADAEPESEPLPNRTISGPPLAQVSESTLSSSEATKDAATGDALEQPLASPALSELQSDETAVPSKFAFAATDSLAGMEVENDFLGEPVEVSSEDHSKKTIVNDYITHHDGKFDSGQAPRESFGIQPNHSAPILPA